MKGLDIKSSLDELKQKQMMVNNIFKSYFSGKFEFAFNEIKKMVDETLIVKMKEASGFKGNPIYTDIDNNLDELYLYRGRIIDSYQSFLAKDMFHIPLTDRHIVNTYRYSVPGVPAIYLALNSYVVWNELGNPKLENLTISYYRMNKLLEEKIIDISYPIQEIPNYLEKENFTVIKEKHEKQIDHIIKMIKNIPLIIACSVVCSDVNRIFKEEYIFPQMLMQVLSNKGCIGIAYKSVQIDNTHLFTTNLAIPITEFEENEKYGKIMEEIEIGNSYNIGYFKTFILPNLTKIRKPSEEGPAYEKNENFGYASRAKSTFNKNMLFSGATYDSIIPYKDSLFYLFDEYLIRYTEIEK